MDALFKEFDRLFNNAEWRRAIELLTKELPRRHDLLDKGQNLLSEINAPEFLANNNARRQMSPTIRQWRYDVEDFLGGGGGGNGKGENPPPPPPPTNRIFVSHNSADAPIARDFVRYFLREGLQIPVDQIFSMSHPATAVPAGDDFRKSIKDAIQEAKIVFFIVSENFKNSQFCIAEMGAAWVLSKTMIQIRIPPFHQYHSGELLAPLQYVNLNEQLELVRLRDHIVQSLGVGKIQQNSVPWHDTLDEWMARLQSTLPTIPLN